MRIAFVNNTKKWGGVKTWVLTMARSFQEDGHSAFVLGKDPVFIDKARAMNLNATLHRPGFDYNPLSIAFYRRFFIEKHIDQVVVNISKDVRTAGIAAKLCAIPVVCHVGAPNDFSSTFKTRLDCRLIKPRFLCSSAFIWSGLQKHAPHVRQYEGHCIYPGVEIPATSKPPPQKPYKLITTSRLSPDKGHSVLIGALAVLASEGRDFFLTVLGDGPERGALEKYVRESGLAGRVRFTGFTTDIETHLAGSHIFILPTFSEPLGIALEEAMAHGLVSVARRSGGVPEIWPSFCPELLAGPKDGKFAFVRILRQLLELPEHEIQALGLRFKEHAENCFSQPKQYRALYNWLVQ